MVGTVVLTVYNKHTYRVEDVDFSTNPRSTFPMKDGKMISYMDYYYNKYTIRITNASQPMLLTRNKPKDRQADKGEPVYLVPELCCATGACNRIARGQFLISELIICIIFRLLLYFAKIQQ